MERLTERDAYWYGEEFWTSAKEPDEEEIDKIYFKLKEYEDLEEQLESVYGECDGLLEKVVEHLVRHERIEIGSPFKARLLTDEDVDKWQECKYLEEQRLILKLPCEVGEKVYVVTTCKDFGKVLDGTLWGEGGGFGTATGYYCPYELNDSCPHEDDFEECEGGCECFENKLAIFEDYVESIMIHTDGIVVFLGNCGSASFLDFGRTIFLTREEAENILKSE